jgi:hypothetical protein
MASELGNSKKQTKVRFQVFMAISMKMAVFWDVAQSSMVIMYAVSSSVTSVIIYQTTHHNIPETAIFMLVEQ